MRTPREPLAPGLTEAANRLRGYVHMAQAFGWGEMSTDDVLLWVAAQLDGSADFERVEAIFRQSQP